MSTILLINWLLPYLMSDWGYINVWASMSDERNSSNSKAKLEQTKKTVRLGRTALAAKRQNLDISARDNLMLHVCQGLLSGKLTQGEALRKLRLGLLSVNQEQYAKMVGVSRKLLSEIESDKANTSVLVLDKVFRGVGLVLTLMPKDPVLRQQLTDKA
ncbi:helix-turn-helix transcriptional regulator [Shewanella sp. SR44-3]|uniref:helix-turn-helix transcriptional regulator n=1 Tax=Shewanella sp. SR44-3 TaxID=2760936 RepID=UPI002175A1AE|nr:helix-turn-helix domain-containing protein [Shewanella sp. SR44-3]